MTLRNFIRDNPKRKLILLWFNDDGELKTDYCSSDKLSKQANKMLDMEVMDTDSYDEEDWIEVWLR